MQMEERKLGDSTVIRVLESRFGADKATSFKRSMIACLETGKRRLVLDLSRVEFIASSALGAILWLLKQMGEGGELIICAPTAPVADMFKLTRMDRVFSIHATVEDAVASLAG